MISIQSAMLVALGFLGATLLALLIAPAFYARAVRLTTSRIKATMPLTDLEIRADKDRIRAEYAVEVHKLESRMEQVKLAAARQQIELNRRDARINEVETALDDLKAGHEEAQNARRVLEQTVAERLPRVERRLEDAKGQLFARDKEIIELARTTEAQMKALNEAAAINAQHRLEIERLETSLAVRGARNQAGLSDPRFDGEVALRAEIEALRAKTRDQSQLVDRLQASLRMSADSPVEPAGGRPAAAVSPSADSGEASAGLLAQQAEFERQLRMLRSVNEDQSQLVAKLQTELAVFRAERNAESSPGVRESRIGQKARLQSLEAQNTQLTETVQSLRAELAAANERAARQAAHFASELKRLGAGTLPASSQTRRTAEPQTRLSLAERIAQARSVQTAGTAAEGASVSSGGERSRSSNGDAAGAHPETETTARVSVPVAADSVPAAVGPQPAKPRLLDRISTVGRTR